jgi:hypothetical protein
MNKINKTELPSKEFIRTMKRLLGIDVSATQTVFDQSDMYSIGLTGLWETFKCGERTGYQKLKEELI